MDDAEPPAPVIHPDAQPVMRGGRDDVGVAVVIEVRTGDRDDAIVQTYVRRVRGRGEMEDELVGTDAGLDAIANTVAVEIHFEEQRGRGRGCRQGGGGKAQGEQASRE
jgi:hypothetical protein